MGKREDAVNALAEIVERDPGLLNDSRKFMSFFSDLAPESKKYGAMLNTALMQGVHKVFMSCGDSEDEKATAVMSARRKIEDILVGEGVEFVIEAFSAAFGVKYVPSADTVVQPVEPVQNIQPVVSVESGMTDEVSKLLRYAEKGDADAQYTSGLHYDYGLGVPKNPEKAVYWYTKAAEQGDADAQYDLGICYEEGRGVPGSLRKAKYWYAKAAEQGHDRAKYRLKRLGSTA